MSAQLPTHRRVLPDTEEQDAVSEVLAEYFHGDLPASMWVEVSRLVALGLKLEMSAIAVVASRERG